MLDSETRAPATLHKPLGVTPKLKADWEFVPELREFGRTMRKWRERSYDALGGRSPVGIAKTYL